MWGYGHTCVSYANHIYVYIIYMIYFFLLLRRHFKCGLGPRNQAPRDLIKTTNATGSHRYALTLAHILSCGLMPHRDTHQRTDTHRGSKFGRRSAKTKTEIFRSTFLYEVFFFNIFFPQNLCHAMCSGLHKPLFRRPPAPFTTPLSATASFGNRNISQIKQGIESG